MFSIGVQLSFRELLRVGQVALVGGNAQVLLTLGLGYVVGMALGWSSLEALFFGAVISNSSSTVLTKILDERGELGTQHGRIALTWSSVQDLGTVLLVVMLSALAAEGDGLLLDSLRSIAIAAIFLAVLAPLGTVVLPWIFERVAAVRSRELFVLTVAVAALGTAFAATFFGLSLALGAFIAGVVVGESDLSHQILGEVMPLRDVFAGLFFVSLGMLVNPIAVAESPSLVLLTVALIVLAKGMLSTAITLLFGYAARTALLTEVTLAQSAEFSFLLARLGTDLGVVSSTVFSVMLAGVAGSMLFSPVLHQAASPLSRWLESHPFLLPTTARPDLNHQLPERLRGHAVICGYGRVGSIVAGALLERRLPQVVIDEDRRVVQRVRERGVRALLGNAANPVLLEPRGRERSARPRGSHPR